MIASLLDTDMYKLTMMQAVFHRYMNTNVEYEFVCRNNISLANLHDIVYQNIEQFGQLTFSGDDLKYLKSLKAFKDDFLDYLSTYRLHPDKHVCVGVRSDMTGDNEQLSIRIAGPWIKTILYEVPILAMVNEEYFQKTYGLLAYQGTARATEKLARKLDLTDGTHLQFTDFGTRRRCSYIWQDTVLGILSTNPHCVGTSNLFFARKHGMNPVGTMAHEFLQAAQSMVPVIDSQSFALHEWLKEYDGHLAIALSDIFGCDAFFKDFSKHLSKAYDGCRHDSGDPMVWCQKLIRHYNQMRIDPRTKMALFSDSLTFPKMREIWNEFHDRINLSFGIGTDLMNDFDLSVGKARERLNIVIKMVRCNGQSVAKISDEPGKTICRDEVYAAFLRNEIRRKNEL